MYICFNIRGRLGNAIFRYLASAILCIISNRKYSSKLIGGINITDEMFYNISKNLLENKLIKLPEQNLIMSDFYQHDKIYLKYREEIFKFINTNREHLIITDGINGGDMKCETYKMYDILNTPKNFLKKYNNVLHLRLEDFVRDNLYIKVDRIINLLNKNILTDNTLCIVFKKISNEFENKYINTICTFLKKKNINIVFESNDVITDYYIMKESKLLICSNSTLSWCAAFFSEKNQICYFPDYNIKGMNSTCKSPVINTILY